MSRDSSDNQLYAMRHSLAHIMASAVQRLWPEAKFGVGPVVEHGFYYDIDIGDEQISEEDFPRIEKEMRQIIADKQSFKKQMLSIDEAIAWAQEHNQPYKKELLFDLKREGTTLARELDASLMGLDLPAGVAGSTGARAEVGDVSFYQNGEFFDLCRGPHVESTDKVGAFKLMRVAGAYWRGDETKPQMQRLYGVAFASEKELRQHLTMLEEAKKRDHRKLGQELDLFVLSDLVGPGLPLFTPRGTVLRDQLEVFSQELQQGAGYQRVWTPHITRTELYKVSGHYEKYPERFDVSSIESSDDFMMKPMNCPHHVQIYETKPRSYRDLPLRYMENATTYRDEKHGELHGLSRVRAISMDDGHVFCCEDQIKDEMYNIMSMIQDMYDVLGMEWHAELSFRDDSDKYLGDRELWERAQKKLIEVADELKLDYVVQEGEAAFYGPKIDIIVKDGLGRGWQCATEQLDFVQPDRFNLEYVGDDGEPHQPVMIHKALLGSVERFLSVYIEHTAGKFPVWLAPEQLRIITVNQEDDTVACAEDMLTKAKELGVRAEVDNSNESVGKKIRNAEVMKVPYTVVIGEKEIASGKVVPRVRKDMEVQPPHQQHKMDDFLQTIANEAKSRVTKTSL